MGILSGKTFSFFSIVFYFLSSFPFSYSLSTISISETNNQTLVCALIYSSNQQPYLNCTSFPQGFQIPENSNLPVSSIVSGNGFLCALSSSSLTSIMVCWRFSTTSTNMTYKRIYRGPVLKELVSGNSHICGLVNETNRLYCWQWQGFNSSSNSFITSNIAVGENFVCGLTNLGQLQCLGSYTNVTDHVPTGNYSVVAAGFRHACAISLDGSLECWGDMVGEKPRGEFTSLALGEKRSCALTRTNGTVVCWGESGLNPPASLRETSFLALEANRDVFCGVTTMNFSLYCWGNGILDANPAVFNGVLPGPCRNECPCGPLPNSGNYCGQGLMICNTCFREPSGEIPPSIVPSRPPSSPSPSLISSTTKNGSWNRKTVAFFVVGCIGSLSLVVVCCFFFFRYCKVRGSRIHDSGHLDEAGTPQQGGQTSQSHQAPPVLEKRLSHLISIGNGGQFEEFSLQALLEATEYFSEDNKIGTGSFGSVYHGTLNDGREVAIKRAEVSASSSYAGGTKRGQEDTDNAFLTELEFLSRLNHKNLVRLLGYCEECDERVLVYEYMNNGTLHDHLHKLESSPLMSWSARIKVALHAARGIEYLHEYAVPPVIHRDIKSSNILLDATWTAKVSDFGLSLMGPQEDVSHLSLRAAGTVGYMDPEYYRLQQLTTKSDVYSFGVVLLELLSGYKAIHRNESGIPRNVVDFVVPYIVQDEIHRVLDRRVPPPTPFEIEAVAYVGYLAVDCVTLEGRDRPAMSEVVNSLERALTSCLAPPTFSRSTTDDSSA